MKIIERIKDLYYRNLPMVSYWKTSDAVEAKVTRTKDGHYVMYMKGEKEPFPGYPRGTLLYGTTEEISLYLRKEAFPYVFNLADQCKYDMVPPEVMVPPVKELHRAMTVAGIGKWKDIATFIFEEDDAYRMRFQWIAKFIKKPTIEQFLAAVAKLEHGELVSDMKERIRLIHRVLSEIVKDPEFRAAFERVIKEIDWKKVRLSDADKYFFRAKYFKVDWPEYQY
jgi:glycerophosphoryl diester phosphodiesterase